MRLTAFGKKTETIVFFILFYCLLVFFLMPSLIRMSYKTKAFLVIHSNNPPSHICMHLREEETPGKCTAVPGILLHSLLVPINLIGCLKICLRSFLFTIFYLV